MAASASPDSEQFDVDLSLSIVNKPVRMVYRPAEVEKLQNFFFVDNIKDETKFKAREQLDSFKEQIKT